MKTHNNTEASRAEMPIREFSRAAGALTIAAITYPLTKLFQSDYRIQAAPNQWHELELDPTADITELELPAPKHETKPAS